MSALDVGQLHGKQLTSMVGGGLFSSLPVMSRTLTRRFPGVRDLCSSEVEIRPTPFGDSSW